MPLVGKTDCIVSQNRLFYNEKQTVLLTRGLTLLPQTSCIHLQPCQDVRWVASLFCACVNSLNVIYKSGNVMRSEQISLQA